MDVSDVLRDRMHPREGLGRMAVVSAFGHVSLVALIILAPDGWLSSGAAEPEVVMTISLSSGAPGPSTGGMNQIGGQMVQEAAELSRREVVTPSAARTPAMTLPDTNSRAARPVTKTSVKDAPAEARGRTPSRGNVTSPGTAPVDTGGRGQGIGLSSAGGSGSGVKLDITGEFCCPAYLEVMKQEIERNWDKRAETAAVAIVKFTIVRDGTLTDVSLETSSGSGGLDLRAQRALNLTRKLPPLPAAFTNPTLTVHLTFEYTR